MPRGAETSARAQRVFKTLVGNGRGLATVTWSHDEDGGNRKSYYVGRVGPRLPTPGTHSGGLHLVRTALQVCWLFTIKICKRLTESSTIRCGNCNNGARMNHTLRTAGIF